MKKVDFFIVGFMKSGTTALASFLDQHPEICISVPKEPAYFAKDLMKESDAFHGHKVYFKVRTPKQYEDLFKHAHEEHLYGEASTAYIYSKEAAKNIHTYNPDAKIIIMVRNPVEFMHALHMQYVNETVEDEEDFEKALALEQQRKKGNRIPKRVRVPSYLFYTERLKYYQQIKRYFDVFPKKQILVVLHDDFLKDNRKTYSKVLKFIGADPVFKPDFDIVHGSKSPRSRLFNAAINYPPFKNTLHKLLGGHRYTKLHKSLSSIIMRRSKRTEMTPETKKRLRKLSRPEMTKLSELLGTDLVKRWLGHET